MDFGNERARDSFKKSLKDNFQRKCRKRVDVAQKLAPNCPNLGPARGQNDGGTGGPGPYDGHRAGSKNKRKDSKATTSEKIGFVR